MLKYLTIITYRIVCTHFACLIVVYISTNTQRKFNVNIKHLVYNAVMIHLQCMSLPGGEESVSI